MCFLCCCFGKDQTDEDLMSDTNTSIQDLNKIFKKRAWDSFVDYRKEKRQHKWFNVLSPKTKKFSLECDWSGVNFIPEEPTFKINPKHSDEGMAKTTIPVSHVIFKSTFKNNSPFDQENSLKVERQTTSSCKSSITKGYTRGFNVGLSIAAPGDIAKAAVGFSQGFTVDNVIENLESKKLTWTAEGVVKVGKESTIEATMHINEYNLNFDFNTWVAAKGTVKTSIFNSDKKCVHTITENLRTAIHEGTLPKGLSTKEVKNTAYIEVAGKCEFQYGIEQGISINPKIH